MNSMPVIFVLCTISHLHPISHACICMWIHRDKYTEVYRTDRSFNSGSYLCRYITWILVAAVYHLPKLKSMGVDIRMSLSLGFNVFVTSVLFLLFFHIVFIGLWYIGLVSRVAGRRPAILTILQNCAVSHNLYHVSIFFTCYVPEKKLKCSCINLLCLDVFFIHLFFSSCRFLV